ncbi:hypothetical protein [Dokdonella soli]|uniref:Collagen-like protein n=1 Tax=Dokdonella soli TaxID=529810 RepID=A0ABN1IUL6_9GAMM
MSATPEDVQVVVARSLAIVTVTNQRVDQVSTVQQALVVQQAPTANVTTDTPRQQVIAAGQVGPPGPPGPSGTETFVGTAGQNIAGYQVVKVQNTSVTLVDVTNPADAPLAVGFAVTGATTGNPVTVQTAGEVTDALWSWSPGPLFVGPSSLLTQAVPAAGSWLQVVGRAVSATAIVLNFQTPIQR